LTFQPVVFEERAVPQREEECVFFFLSFPNGPLLAEQDGQSSVSGENGALRLWPFLEKHDATGM
jgi:hypothetical protein